MYNEMKADGLDENHIEIQLINAIQDMATLFPDDCQFKTGQDSV